MPRYMAEAEEQLYVFPLPLRPHFFHYELLRRMKTIIPSVLQQAQSWHTLGHSNTLICTCLQVFPPSRAEVSKHPLHSLLLVNIYLGGDFFQGL